MCGFHAPAGGNSVRPMEDCLLASELGNRAREVGARLVSRAGLSAWERGRSRARRPGARDERVGPAADGRARLRNLVVREGRRSGKLQVRIVTTEGELEAGELARRARRGSASASAACCGRARAARRDDAGRRDRAGMGRGRAARAPGRARPADLLRGVLPDQHRDGRAALRDRRRVRCAGGLGAGLRPLQRDRPIALTLAPRAGELWGIELVEQAVADAIEGARRNGISNARFFAGDTRLALPELSRAPGAPM